ncbi:MAG: methyltransferase [Saprospiraceae bacterium]|nr:methyltransferase [Saprospiraceae bacterium]MCB9322528.1 methyltransferase [Lewinellaceae bacterium]
MISKKTNPFRFKQFTIRQDQTGMKVGTDGILLGAWANIESADAILDIGSGSGVIALMLAQRNPFAAIQAVEIDEHSFAEASENIRNSPWPGRVQIFHTSIQEFSKSTPDKFDAIVSNPPFFSGGTFSDSQERNNVRHTVKLPHGELLLSVRKLLSEEGRFSLILPYLEGLRFCELAESYNLYCVRSQEVLPKLEKPVERLLMEFRKKKPDSCYVEKKLVIQKGEANDWTDDYRNLTNAFYLNM